MPARSGPIACYLHIVGGYWQGHVEDYVDVELRLTLTHETVLVLTAVEVAQILAHYVGAARITSGLLARLPSSDTPRPALPSASSQARLRAVGVPLRPVQEARRTARARRRKSP